MRKLKEFELKTLLKCRKHYSQDYPFKNGNWVDCRIDELEKELLRHRESKNG